ncbi:MAG TPA: hypothetical protein PKZ64_01950 [Spirochaetota bacterium]|nr:hypothetical protein [Spirochaetota bacterium]
MSIILVIALVIILLLLAWALFGSRGTPADIPEKKSAADNDSPERVLRRRASDRAIEREFPEEKAPELTGSEPVPESRDTSGALQLPFSANEIIPDNSRFRLYKRTLINSEVYARKGDIETAISLFRGVRDRILDSSVRDKIDGNIEYLNHFRQRRDDDIKKKIESRISEQQQAGGELRLKIDGPVPSTINIGLPDKGIDSEEIISKISEQISKELNTIRDEVDRLRAKPEEKFDLDDYAEFASLQHELKTLKDKFSEISGDRDKALNELSRLRELKEQEAARDIERDKSDLLNQIRNEMEKLNTLKNSLDKLHDRFDDMAKIPETNRAPAVIEARYEAPIPIHFDPKPVLEILEKLTEKKSEQEKEDSAQEPPEHETTPEEELFTSEELEQFTELEAPEEPESIPEFSEAEPHDELTLDEIEGFEEELPAEEEMHQEEELFPEPEIFPEPEVLPDSETEPHEETAEVHEDIPEITEQEAEELISEFEAEPDKEILPEAPDEPESIPEFIEEEPQDELTLDEIEGFEEELPAGEETPEETPVEETPVLSPAEAVPVEENLEEVPDEPLIPEEILKSEKEKEIEKYTEAEEDANDFDLLSEYGKPKDDSTLTDEDIFEKILKDDNKKTDDSQFEILGEQQKDEQEYSFDDSRLDEKKKNDLDFYKKFIKPDRIKKRELPILKVSFDFKKLPDEFSLSREKNILEYSFYKYKPMLQKADEFIKHRQVRDAINYYKVVADQNIPVEFKAMIRRNIRDLTEYLEKYLSSE